MRLRYICALFIMATAPLSASASQDGHPPGEFVTVLGQRVWYESEGQGEPLILVGGGPGGSHDYFHPYFSRLSGSARVIYYDGFGRGKADRAKSLDQYSFARDVDELEGLRKQLGLGKVNIFGHSYGGFVAQAFALKYPDSVKRLILANTFASPGADWQASNEHINGEIRHHLPELWRTIQRLRAQGHKASSKVLQEAYFGQFETIRALFYFYDPDNVGKVVFSEHTFNAEMYYRLAGPDADFQLGGEMAGLDFGRRLRSLKMPVLIMFGRADGVVTPQLAMKFARYLPKAERVVFDRSGHFPFIEEEAKTMSTLKAFLGPG